ncbi:MAG TPA: GtrA family protein [Verrucomicrobiae bacterium]
MSLHKLIRFGLTGGVVFCVDVLLVWAFSRWFAPTVAVTLAYALAVALHFCLNKWWVFGSFERAMGREIWRYLIVVFACWACTISIVQIVMAWIYPNVVIAKILAVPPSTLLGYLLMRSFVFRAGRDAPATETVPTKFSA